MRIAQYAPAMRAGSNGVSVTEFGGTWWVVNPNGTART